MVVPAFRSRIKPGAKDEYMEWAQRMAAIATTLPGYVSHKGFTAEDGERVTIVEFRLVSAPRDFRPRRVCLPPPPGPHRPSRGPRRRA